MRAATDKHPDHPGNVPQLRRAAARRPSRRGRLWLSSLLALGFSGPALAASLEGTVVNEMNEPLDKVPLCLRMEGEERRCSKIQSSNRNGQYSFNGLKEGYAYTVSVYQDDTASGRRFDRYRTYVWGPVQQEVTLASRKDSATLETFVGEFNFSNFQRSLTLTGADFPELRSLDLLSEYVMLKVFVASSVPDTPPETIFLGQVRNADKLTVAASVPLAASSISYQIYSASLSIDGSIDLAGGQ